MQQYTYHQIRTGIQEILAKDYPCTIGGATWESAEDRLVNLIDTITETCHSAGKLEVQQGIINALDLRHLLGV